MAQDYNMNYASDSIQRYSDVDVFSTQGRIGGKRYFVYSIILPILIFWAIATVAAIASYLPVVSTTIFYAIIGIAILATMFMLFHLTIQRCHDFNKSGALAILAIIPFANIIFALIPGTNGLNSYGEVPVPATWKFKMTFYALVALLIGTGIFVAYKASTSQFISELLVF